MNAMEGVGFKLYVPSGRINFESGLGKTTKSPAFSTVVLKLQKEREIEIIDVNLLKPSKPVKNKSEQLELDILNLL